MSKFFKELKKKNKKLVEFLSKDVEQFKIREFVNTGNLLMNLLLSGKFDLGMPIGRTIQLAGESGSGKSFFSQMIVKMVQDLGYHIIYIDTEGAQDVDSLERMGIDFERFSMISLSTVKETQTFLLQIAEQTNDEKIFVVLDSIGMLTTNKEYSDAIDGINKKDMTRAQEIKGLFRTISVPFATNHIGFMAVNHVYSSMSAYGGNVVSGGGGVLFAPSVTLSLTKSQEKHGTELIGSGMRARVYKSRYIKEGTWGRVVINFRKGIDKYSGLFDFIYENLEEFKRAGSWYSHIGESRKEYKFQRNSITPALWEEMLKDGLQKKTEASVAFGDQSVKLKGGDLKDSDFAENDSVNEKGIIEDEDQTVEEAFTEENTKTED